VVCRRVRPATPRRRRVPWVLLGTVLWIGCAGDGPSGTPGAVATPTPTPVASSTYDLIQAEVFDVNCLSAGCHNAAGQAAGLILEPSVSYGDLVNVTPTNPTAGAQGLLRVTPDNPEQSYLYVKLLGPEDPRLGGRMPLGQAPLADAQIELIRSWILAGAPGPTTAPGR
jgi:hypothetical protein